jgi:hypothetical protein
MFWRKNSLNINAVRMLCRRLCRDPQKLLIAVKNFQPGPLMRSARRPVQRAAFGNASAGCAAKVAMVTTTLAYATPPVLTGRGASGGPSALAKLKNVSTRVWV